MAPSSTRRTGSPATGWCPTPRCFVGFEQIAEADPARVRTVLSRVHRADTFRAVLEAVSPVLPEAAAALAGGADLDALVTREMAAKRAEKEAKAKEGARG